MKKLPAMRPPSWVQSAAVLVILAGMTACQPRPSPAGPALVPAGAKATADFLPGIENARRIGPSLWSGGEPSGDAAFAALAAHGVRVVVSVDGARPNLEAARRHGLRYVHVPIGYEGVPRAAAEELAALALERKGGVFVHCHHGRHRGPTAAAIMAMAAGAWDGATANAWQHAAGTSQEYAGLYRSVRDFAQPDPGTLRSAARRLRPYRPPTGLVASMVAGDHHAEALDAMQRNGWKPVASRPDETPVQAARLLREQFVESIRLGHGPDAPRFREAMERFEHGVGDMEGMLRAGDMAPATAAWQALRENCRTCHRAWRDGR